MDDYQPGRELESINLKLHENNSWISAKDLVDNQREVQAGAVYIEVFCIFTCVCVLVYVVPKSS